MPFVDLPFAPRVRVIKSEGRLVVLLQLVLRKVFLFELYDLREPREIEHAEAAERMVFRLILEIDPRVFFAASEVDEKIVHRNRGDVRRVYRCHAKTQLILFLARERWFDRTFGRSKQNVGYRRSKLFYLFTRLQRFGVYDIDAGVLVRLRALDRMLETAADGA